MYNGQRIKDLAIKKGMLLKDIVTKADLIESSFYQMIGPKGNPKASNLEMIANILECSIDDFFDRDFNKMELNDKELKISFDLQAKEIDHLKQLVEEKERTIQILMNKK